MATGGPDGRREYRFRISKKDVEKYGPSEDCEGCRRAMIGDKDTRGHTEACRDRFGMEFMKDGDPRAFQELDRLQRQEDIGRELVESRTAREAQGEPNDMEITPEEEEENSRDEPMNLGDTMRLSAGGEERENLNKLCEGIRRSWRDDEDRLEDMIKGKEPSICISEVRQEVRDKVSKIYDLMPGWVVDFTVPDPKDGEEWDFNKQHIRDKAERLVIDKRALLIIGSRSGSAHNKGDENWDKRINKGSRHREFCAKLYICKTSRDCTLYTKKEREKRTTRRTP